MENIPIRYINTAPQQSGFAESFQIRDLRDMLAGKDMIQDLHRHDFFYVLALQQGAGNHAIDFTAYDVKDHVIFFIRPGQVHALTLKAGSTGYMMAFKADGNDQAFHQLLRKVGHTNYYPGDAARFDKLHAMLAAIFQEQADQEEGYQPAIKAYLDIFFIALARQQQHNALHPVHTYAESQLEAFNALLDTHIATHKQVAAYAALLHLSAYQLNAITKATRGKTCSALINEHIILEAKRYLLATPDQVNQIAWHLGYEDVSYFIRFFKKHTGHTPEAFRHNFR
ncbi:AraC family transcriptional regulator [Chitinophaga nivalis]|uniref:AraC family transcriptional regulator n=1 Tax=Chitinophaga nivalis TaxID=2991709 RepID=A0ABT3IH59_9BACT|nr:AraC family transcriptional regulator [Chitinophaga nivalis]MCW3467027.1 AraC family transcriptional regulator [Chitinophaga nivalis]MCW3483282.1 AraC family transcriptional regulator [Chitinophaga nivalis]